MEADTYIKDEAFDLFHEAVLFRFTETGGKSLCHSQLTCPGNHLSHYSKCTRHLQSELPNCVRRCLLSCSEELPLVQQDILGKGSPQHNDTIPWGCPGKEGIFCSQGQLPLGRSCLQKPLPFKKTMWPTYTIAKNHKSAWKRHLTAWAVSTKVPFIRNLDGQ